MPKYVVSTTLTDPEWANTHVIAGDVADRVRQLKDETAQDIVQYGFGSVSRLLVDHGLLDELRLWVHPLVLGRGSVGDLLFGEMTATAFHLTDAITLSDGIVILNYTLDGVISSATS
jgi:dihydrofolate reductase